MRIILINIIQDIPYKINLISKQDRLEFFCHPEMKGNFQSDQTTTAGIDQKTQEENEARNNPSPRCVVTKNGFT